QTITGKEVHARRGGVNGHRSAAIGLYDPGRPMHQPGRSIQHEIVIVDAGQSHLLVIAVDSLADGTKLGEVERGSLDRSDLARRNHRSIHPGECAGLDGYSMLQDVTTANAGEIEVGMLRQFDVRGPVRLR